MEPKNKKLPIHDSKHYFVPTILQTKLIGEVVETNSKIVRHAIHLLTENNAFINLDIKSRKKRTSIRQQVA
jgi:hypothetical protein